MKPTIGLALVVQLLLLQVAWGQQDNFGLFNLIGNLFGQQQAPAPAPARRERNRPRENGSSPGPSPSPPPAVSPPPPPSEPPSPPTPPPPYLLSAPAPEMEINDIIDTSNAEKYQDFAVPIESLPQPGGESIPSELVTEDVPGLTAPITVVNGIAMPAANLIPQALPIPADPSCRLINIFNQRSDLSLSSAVFSQPGVRELLDDPSLEPMTLLVPTDQAWNLLIQALEPQGFTIDQLFAPENREALIAVATYHMIPGVAWAAEDFQRLIQPGLPRSVRLQTLYSDQPIVLYATGGGTYAYKFLATSRQVATISSSADIKPCAEAAVIAHAINTVLSPDPDWQETQEQGEQLVQATMGP